ncbi:hypothetical protein [Planomicrobium sp. YIM 101495]|nr:hypothetical protein [Planomicrobium sp. YIM 101495]
MRELIGTCKDCGKEVYCENGFLNGTHEDGELLCFSCAEERNTDNTNQK